jgi:hypothetical protein
MYIQRAFLCINDVVVYTIGAFDWRATIHVGLHLSVTSVHEPSRDVWPPDRFTTRHQNP